MRRDYHYIVTTEDHRIYDVLNLGAQPPGVGRVTEERAINGGRIVFQVRAPELDNVHNRAFATPGEAVAALIGDHFDNGDPR